ncbi:MAG: hypothetical protein HXL36_00885 [Prevotellaceae bacterium]|nr:hypothetical protein [Prevotellaceae bacterium]
MTSDIRLRLIPFCQYSTFFISVCYIKQDHNLQGLLPAICCSAAVNSACGGRRTTCMTAVSNAADGRRTMTFTT